MNGKAFQHHECIKHRGKFWFSPGYAAGLLGTTERKIEMAMMRRLLPYRTIEDRKYLPEEAVTTLRRDPSAMKAIKRKLVEKEAPKRQASMPSSTLYVGDAVPDRLVVSPRIGHPLKDQG